MKKKLKVMVLMDLTEPRPDQNFEEDLKQSDWKTEREVVKALRKLGHDVQMVGLFDDISPFMQAVQTNRPDIVFNCVESFNNNTTLERDVIGLVEMMGLPFTGTGPTGLMLCKNKGLMKKLLSFHHIKTPKFVVFEKGKPIKKPKALKYPLFIKPDKEDASYGISQASYVENEDALIERVKFLHESMNQNALVEEYVDGRELYVGLMGSKRLRVFTPRELVFDNVPEDEPKIATFKAKWDAEYKEKWGIKWRFVAPLASGVLERISKVCKKVFKVMHLSGYGRMDLKVTPQNEIMIIEANPNPAIGRDEDLAMSADHDGVPYEKLIQKILEIGLLGTNINK